MSLASFAHHSVRFNERGHALESDAADKVVALRQRGDTPFTDLLILSHGWNNNADQARALYDALLTSLIQVASANNPPITQTLAVLALHWPSKQFDFERRSAQDSGGAAALDTSGRSGDIAQVIAALEDLRDLTETDAAANSIDIAIGMVPKLDDLRSAQDAFVATLLPLLANDDDVADADPGDAPTNTLNSLTGREVLDLLDRPPPPRLASPRDDRAATGGAAGGVAAGAQRGAFSFVNLLTFWKMKKRAGKVGRRGVAALLTELGAALPDVRIHLAGHSFGARVATAAAMAVAPATNIASLTLLQGAFSHHGFSADLTDNPRDPRPGGFRSVIEEQRVRGPILTTHTRNDRAVGLAYPMAARLSRDDAAALGDADSRYGGIGSNGAVRTAEAIDARLLSTAGSYDFQPGHIHNLKADDFISGHSDITGPEVAAALLAAIQHRETPP